MKRVRQIQEYQSKTGDAVQLFVDRYLEERRATKKHEELTVYVSNEQVSGTSFIVHKVNDSRSFRLAS